MCGIAGWAQLEGESPRRESLEASCAALAHRGPDGRGTWLAPSGLAGLGHTRLAIIDVAGGNQPLANEDGSVQVVFNGEIYNHVELRLELEAAGHRFRSDSDTEVLVHLYEERGWDMLSALRGMFALALWDERRRGLLLARDRLGKKPLYWAGEGTRLAFASELKGLWPLVDTWPLVVNWRSIKASPDFSARPGEMSGVQRERAVWCAQSLYDYLTYQYVPGERCAARGVAKVLPGEFLWWQEGQVRRERYWRPPSGAQRFAGTFEEASRELRRRLEEATAQRLRSDVPVGALLSGGVDSACVVALMAGAGARRVRTFTAVFDEGGFDERQHARVIARHVGSQHTELTVRPLDWPLAMRIARQFDEPFADSSALATWGICAAAREHVKVVLTGDGGDESLLGYTRYEALERYAQRRRWLLPLMRGSGLRWLAGQLCGEESRRTWRRRLRTFTRLWDVPLPANYERWLAIFGPRERAGIVREKLRQQLNAGEELAARLERAMTDQGEGWGAAAARFDLQSYLPDDILVKVDRASMAHGLECRSPLLDQEVVEFLATVPAAWKRHPRHGPKWILRHACRDLLPRDWRRDDKMGFAVPVGKWFRGVWRGEAERLPERLGPLGEWLDLRQVERLVSEHLAGEVDHGYRLWSLACLAELTADYAVI